MIAKIQDIEERVANAKLCDGLPTNTRPLAFDDKIEVFDYLVTAAGLVLMIDDLFDSRIGATAGDWIQAGRDIWGCPATDQSAVYRAI